MEYNKFLMIKVKISGLRRRLKNKLASWLQMFYKLCLSFVSTGFKNV